MRTADRVVVVAAVLLGLGGCGGGSGRIDPATGASSPEEAVETFLNAAREAQGAKAAGQFTTMNRAYERMAAVFGTSAGSIHGSYSAQEVRDRMVILAACLRPTSYRILSQPNPQAWTEKETIISVDLSRERERVNVRLPFRVVLGRGNLWYVEQIQLDSATFKC